MSSPHPTEPDARHHSASPLPETAGGASPLEGRTCLVTGAGGGIGRGIAVELARRGMTVLVTDIARHALDETATMIEGVGGSVRMLEFDLAEVAAIEKAWADIDAMVERIDLLVNNAGRAHVDPFESLAASTWDSVFDVNARGPFLMTQAYARRAREYELDAGLGRRGAIVCVTSEAAGRARPLLSAYGASKAALNHLVATAAEVVREYDITCFAVYPNSIREGMVGYLAQQMATAEGRSVEDLEKGRQFQDLDEFTAVVAQACELPGLHLSGCVVDPSGDARRIFAP